VGRVETRDAAPHRHSERGVAAVVTISTATSAPVANLSRDWSQHVRRYFYSAKMSRIGFTASLLWKRRCRNFAPTLPGRSLCGRPRILGVQSSDRNATLVRLQARHRLPHRQEKLRRTACRLR